MNNFGKVISHQATTYLPCYLPMLLSAVLMKYDDPNTEMPFVLTSKSYVLNRSYPQAF